ALCDWRRRAEATVSDALTPMRHVFGCSRSRGPVSRETAEAARRRDLSDPRRRRFRAQGSLGLGTGKAHSWSASCTGARVGVLHARGLMSHMRGGWRCTRALVGVAHARVDASHAPEL